MKSFLTFLMVPILAIFSMHTYGQNSSKPQPQKHERTVVDLYCESMAVSLIESALDLTPPMSQDDTKRIQTLHAKILKECKTQFKDYVPKTRQQDMTMGVLSVFACLGTADGIALAYGIKTEDPLSDAKRTRNRPFYTKACINNRTLFLSDIKKYGPDHVLNKTY